MTLLSIKNLSVNFGGVQALQEINLDIPAGVIWGLIGPNGAGKTTLVNLISGLIRPDSGTLIFDQNTGGPWPIAKSVSLGIVRTFQQTRAFLELTVRENLHIAQVGSRKKIDIDPLIQSFALSNILDRTAGEMPYADLRRLGIAMALASQPKLLLLDEPAVGLAADELDRMGKIILECRNQGVTILLIEHNIRFLMGLVDRVSVLQLGRLIFEGTPAECQSNRLVIDAYLGKRYDDAKD
jgi:branched-chain amino acid transport system ATP-binding protein